MNRPIKYINLFDLQSFPEDFLLAKLDIEELKKEEKLSLADFIQSLKFNSVYSIKGFMIPFSIQEGVQYDYIMYSIAIQYNETQEQKKIREEAFEVFKEKLQKIEYDINKLTKKSSLDLLSFNENIINDGNYFIIGNDFYI